MDTHQKLMNEAYDLWKSNDNWSKEEFFEQLDRKHRIAVALGNMNYQVENGGFSQWIYNGYAQNHFRFILLLLGSKSIEALKLSNVKKVYQILIEAERPIKDMIELFGESNRYKSYEDDEDDEYREKELNEELDEFDTKYYIIDNDELLKEFNVILENN